ncbi:NAD(+) diphosphatase [Luteimonas wenzhouensis]|jgi:NAD+ diphosphatase|uniref:NAD(+) diphosphatase n=1 Tax=Luteimonas wenzhouensis TaxID=2599615 RepID=A0A5C5TYW5_9GAMM|nr:NAD(+) diphosphatase [Luteimonas wenzhouensis]NLW96703.1 NAD(+) diphosphatase [Xanthomonadaceae bacterium]TWT18857.1 NAD(+) diphosphatase [Luteimonas wenzhouensis]
MAGATPGFAFVEGALDRAEFLRTRGDRLAELWPDARLLRLDADGRALCATGGAPVDERGAAHPALQAEAVLLGMEGGRAWFAAPDPATDPGAPRVDLRTAAASWPVREATAFAQARAVLHWRARHRHCGACGARLRFERAGWLGRCEGCASEHYPRTDPAVIVAVTDGERLLLGRQADWPPRRYSTLAGFVEPGETLEQTVVREVFEESAVRVRRCRYLASQPWPFPSSLMLGFIAEAEPDVPRPSDEELEDARWFTREEVGDALEGRTREQGLLLSPRLSISRWLVEYWHRGGAA